MPFDKLVDLPMSYGKSGEKGFSNHCEPSASTS